MPCSGALPAFIISSEQVIIQEDPAEPDREHLLSDLPLLFFFSEGSYSRSVGVGRLSIDITMSNYGCGEDKS